MKRDKLIVALDVGTFKEARRLVDRLYPRAGLFKVGMQLFTACGKEVIEYVNKKGSGVFLDLKFHDIPNTVRGAVKSALQYRPFMLTVHASGGKEMMKAAMAAKGRRRYPIIVGVTVLTSVRAPKGGVIALAKAAKASGLNGIVSSPLEARAVRRACGRDFVIVTPGIRPFSSKADDQKRKATPREAIAAGADYLVVGRPIIKAGDPVKAYNSIIENIAS